MRCQIFLTLLLTLPTLCNIIAGGILGHGDTHKLTPSAQCEAKSFLPNLLQFQVISTAQKSSLHIHGYLFNGKGGRRYCTSFSPLVKWRKKRKKVDIKIAGHLSSFTQSVCQRLFRRHINSSFTLYRVHMTSMSYVCHRMMTERPGRIMYFSHSSQRKQLARLCLKVIEVMKVRTCSLSSLINTLCLVCLLRMKGRVWKQMLWCWGGWARDRFFIRSSNFCGVLAFSLFFFFFLTFRVSLVVYPCSQF